MLEILLNWTFLFLTTYVVGFVVLKAFCRIPCMRSRKGSRRVRAYRVHYRMSYLLTGLVVVTVYAQCWSIFAGGGLVADLVLLLICGIFVWCFRDSLQNEIREVIRASGDSWQLPICLVLLLFTAYGSSHGLMHYDSDLYHAQAIHWIETYGSVPGLGNLHNRLAYNSAAFALSALYSGSFLGHSTHAAAGYCAWLLACQVSELARMARRGYPILADFVRFVALYYLFGVWRELVSPATDTFALSLMLLMIILWLELAAKGERSFVPHALLALFAVFLVTVKLTVGPLILLALWPVSRLIRRRKRGAWQPVLVCTLAALGILLPFFIRNIKLSGYLLYPFPSLDLFSLDWKIPVGTAAFDAAEIRAWGRGGTSVILASAGLSEWVPAWFGKLPTVYRWPLLLDALAAPVVCIAAGVVAWMFLRRRLFRRTTVCSKGPVVLQISALRFIRLGDYLFLLVVLYLQLAFWFLSAPLVRYGGVIAWVILAILAGRGAMLVNEVLNRHRGSSAVFGRLLLAAVLLYSAFRTAALIREDIPRMSARYLEVQQDYGLYATASRELGGGVRIYYPTEGDQSGYAPFPATPADRVDRVMLRGETLRQGFRAVW
ncbi:MAG: hypothetical protein IJT34_03220 [Butyrivibrio sp.]|nr:hypothetical protein [Butyrivibrio sp.]